MSYLRYSIRPTFAASETLREHPPMRLDMPEFIVMYWREHIASDPTIDTYKENLLVIAVDTKFNVMGHHLVSVGTQDQCPISIPEALRPVILAGTNRFIMVHNHPSGDCYPSESDRLVTKRMREACELMGMKLIDHVIIGSAAHESYYSFLENGMP